MAHRSVSQCSSAARDLAIANPMPIVEAVTKARLLFRPKFIPTPFSGLPLQQPRQKSFYTEGNKGKEGSKSLLRCFSKLSAQGSAIRFSALVRKSCANVDSK